jgi:hypothetical protein
MPPRDPRSRIRAATAALSFGVYADLAFNLYSATNSSPQTSELFAGEREATLMKYVKLGHVIAVVLGVFGSFLDRTLWPLVGTLSVGAVMHGLYKHAIAAGKGQAPPSNSDAGARGVSGHHPRTGPAIRLMHGTRRPA